MADHFDGERGSEKKFYSPDINTVLEAYQVEETRAMYEGRPRLLARFDKNLEEVEETWTWRKQSSRFAPDGFAWVKTNVRYLRADGSEL